MTISGLPLLDLFYRLREHGFSLGIDDYMAALRAIQAGFGLGNRRALADLCCVLWAKNNEEARHVRRLVEQLLSERPAAGEEPSSPEPSFGPEGRQRAEPGREPPGDLAEAAAPEEPPVREDLVAEAVITDDPAQVAQAIRKGRDSIAGLQRGPRDPLVEYLPVTGRQMKQSWRHLRRPVREGPPVELDVAATVEITGKQGVMLEPILIPRRTNRAALVLLIDQDGSMAPFHVLTRQIIDTAYRGGKLNRAGIYYFHDYPRDYLYTDPSRLHRVPVAEVLAALDEWTAVLTVSDAGAARGSYDSERVHWTRRFLDDIRRTVRHFAWLNPMPRPRWYGATAGAIAEEVPMFDMSRQGLQAAIGVLRGHVSYAEKARWCAPN